MTAHCVATNHSGPFCDDPVCPVCDLFEKKDETREQFVARLTATYGHLGGETHDGAGRPRALPSLARRLP